MYSPSLSTHRFIHALHCSEQCYSSSTLGPFSSCAVFCLHFIYWWEMSFLQYTFRFGVQKNVTGCQIYEYEGCSSIGMRLLGRNFLTERELWAGALSWCRIPALFFHRFGRFFHKICHTVSLLIPTMSAFILTLRCRFLWTISLIFWMFWSVFEVEVWLGC